MTTTGNLTKDENDLAYASMFRITAGLPQHEVALIAKEAWSCEIGIAKEIQILEAAAGMPVTSFPCIGPIEKDTMGVELKGSISATSTSTSSDQSAGTLQTSTIPSAYDPTSKGKNYLTSADAILSSMDLTPLDRYFTVSSLLGRMREPLDTPPPPHSSLAISRELAMAAAEKKKSSQKKSGSGSSSSNSQQSYNAKQLEKYRRLIRLKSDNPIYTQIQNQNTTALLALWKRISSHRTAAVFRRAVNAKEAPGYNDRILFPIDLNLIRKMIVCGHITTFEEMHQKIGLICHNCVKFNGRESDYALLTREFESYVDDSFLDVMQKLKDKALSASVEHNGKK